MRGLPFVAMVLAACDVGKTDEGPHCEDTPSPVALDQPTPLGFAASAVLARLPASEHPTLSWATGGSTPLSLAFRPGTSARFMDSEAVYPEGGTWPAIGVICDDYLQVDVEFDLATADGAFDETLAGDLRAVSAEGGEIRHELALEELHGTFDLDAFTDTRDDERRAWITVAVGDGATTGVIDGQVSGGGPCDEGDTCTAWAEQVEVATWE